MTAQIPRHAAEEQPTNKAALMKISCPVPFAYDSTNLYMTLKEFEIKHIVDLPEDLKREDIKLMPIPLNTFKFNPELKQNIANLSLTPDNQSSQ